MKDIEISIRGIPSETFARLRLEAVNAGVVAADSTKGYSAIIRWAMAQYAQVLEERDDAAAASPFLQTTSRTDAHNGDS